MKDEVPPAIPPAEPFGVYVHFPYCLSKCPYCDFASVAAAPVPHARYADAVLAELRLRALEFPSRPATSVYLGGGTPSLWDPREVARVLAALQEAFPLAAEAEVTIEANPGASDEARFAAYREAGANRISVGGQSFQPAVLAALGRVHREDEIGRAVGAARRAGFGNVSVDLIYGAPGHSPASVRDDARRALDLATEHVSAYALTLEHLAVEVPMARARAAGHVEVPGDDAQAEMGAAVRDELVRGGLRRYEISNFARPGRESRHNLLYWRGFGYIGLGTGASGFVRDADGRGGHRYSNRRDPPGWTDDLEAGRLPEREREHVGPDEIFLERLFTGLRLTEGAEVAALAGISPMRTEALLQRLPPLADGGLAVLDAGRLRLTHRGMELHTAVCARLA